MATKQLQKQLLNKFANQAQVAVSALEAMMKDLTCDINSITFLKLVKDVEAKSYYSKSVKSDIVKVDDVIDVLKQDLTQGHLD